MWIYRKIDKTVKMYINSYQSTVFIPLKKSCVCVVFVLFPAAPINAILASCDVLVAKMAFITFGVF